MNRTERLIMLLVVALAFLARVWMLDDRPAHFDEGINGTFVDGMRESGYYAYQPANYHGPLHFYLLFAAQQLGGRNLWALRMPTVLAGVAAVAMMFAFRRWLSFRTVTVAAVAMALSPGMIFYSRDAIHEMWLVFFTLVAAYGGIGVATDRTARDRWWLGLGLTGMILTKETYLLHMIAGVLALFGVLVIRASTGGVTADDRPDAAALFNPRRQRVEADRPDADPTAAVTNAKVIVTCLGLIVAFYSGFGLNWSGVTGLFETWRYMFAKGYHTGPDSEDGQHKPYWYYAWMLCRYEWPVLIGLAAAPFVSIWPARGIPMPLRFLALFGLASLAGYSLISYKTPWCMLAALPPLLFVAGWLFDRLAAYLGNGGTERMALALLFVAAMIHPAWAAWRLNYRNPINDEIWITTGSEKEAQSTSTGYAYVQTTRDIDKLLKPLQTLIARDPLNRFIRGSVFIEEHPLRWLLGDFPNVEFANLAKLAENPEDLAPNLDADFLLLPQVQWSESPEDLGWNIQQRLHGVYFEIPYLPRSGYPAPCWLFLSAEKFGGFFPGREPEFHPRIPQETTP